MSVSWTAAAVRAKALARRRLGGAGARRLAASPSLDEALHRLAGTPYGHDVRVGQDLAQAQHAVRSTLLWHLRVLAGWQPRAGVEMLRALAAWFEVANVDEHLRALGGHPTEPSYHLGTLATAWPRLRGSASVADLRATLAASAWGDPGAETAHQIGLAMRLSWADRVARLPDAAEWAAGAVALLLARETADRDWAPTDPQVVTLTALLGPAAVAARTLPTLLAALPGSARWALAEVGPAQDLWRAEAAWWRRVDADARHLLRSARLDDRPVLGSAAALGVDAWRTCAALELAARGGDPLEVFDAVA